MIINFKIRNKMKKNILRVTLVTAIALVASVNVYNAQKLDIMSDTAFANVEALAQTETGSSSCQYRMGFRCGEVDYTVPWRPVLTIYDDHYSS